MRCYLFLHWHKDLDPIVMDTIRSKGLRVRHFANSFFEFCWTYFNILCLVALHLFCCFLNPICTFIMFHIFLPYSTPEFSSFFLIRYYIFFMWIFIQFLIELWLVRLEQSVCRYCFTLFLYHFRKAAFALIHCLSSSAAFFTLFFWLDTDDPTLSSDFPFSTFLFPIFQWD